MDAAAWLKKTEDSTNALEKRARMQDLGRFVAEAKTLEDLLLGVCAPVAEFFSAERVGLFVLDANANQLYAMAKALPDKGGEPYDVRRGQDPSNIVGFVALTKASINLRNVYDAAELLRVHPKLRFDDSWDQATGFRTRSMMTLPVLSAEQATIGVLQVMNRKEGGVFFPRDLNAADEITRLIAPALQTLVKAKEQQRAARKAGKWDAVLDGGFITQENLDKALAQASAAGADPGRFLVEKMNVPRAEVEKSLAHFYGCEFHRFTGKEQMPAEIRTRLRPDFLKKACAIPIDRRGAEVVVVIDDPSDFSRTDQLRSLDPERDVVYRLGFRDDIFAAIDLAYSAPKQGGDLGSILRELSNDETPSAEADAEDDDDTKGGESDSAVIKLANQIILDAYRRGASDIHIEPNGKDSATTIRFRIDGDCVAYQDIPSQFRGPLVARIKIMARLDISERRKPQDGKIKFRMQDRQIELRVATLPTVNGNEDVVMRILAASKPMPLAEMGLSDRNFNELKKLVAKPYGLMLVVGPTGSGKTTTLHSALGFINTVDMKIWTAEDPVEITQAGLRQVQVHPKIGFDFATAMRAFLRADPDVIMVGEMRDKETASTGIEASLTGHLVFSTLHTNSAPETITRLMDMGVDPFSFADALLGVLAQRLARSVCGKCKQEYVATPEEVQTYEDSFGPEVAEKRGWKVGQMKLFRGAGCEVCGRSGYKGRVGLHELLVNNEGIKHGVTKHAPVEEIRQKAIEGGMTTLLQDGLEKALLGRTDIKQVLAVCSR